MYARLAHAANPASESLCFLRLLPSFQHVNAAVFAALSPILESDFLRSCLESLAVASHPLQPERLLIKEWFAFKHEAVVILTPTGQFASYPDESRMKNLH